MGRRGDAPGGAGQPMTDADVLSGFFAGVMELAADAQRLVTGSRMVRGGSRCLAWAVEAGLPPQMAYSVADTARYSGVTRATLYAEHEAGRLAFVVPRGAERGAVIRVEEMDRWMEASVG